VNLFFRLSLVRKNIETAPQVFWRKPHLSALQFAPDMGSSPPAGASSIRRDEVFSLLSPGALGVEVQGFNAGKTMFLQNTF
jgi:hypothetical protein